MTTMDGRGGAGEPGLDAETAALQMAAALERPLRTGWALWQRSLLPLLRHLAPIALPLALAVVLLGASLEDVGEVDSPLPQEAETSAPSAAAEEFEALKPSEVLLIVAILGLGIYGLALTSTVLSQQYANTPLGFPELVALRRFVPWFVTSVLVVIVVALGTLALIVPGIILGLRLFWADELTLTHGQTPFGALANSWKLTRSTAGEVFFFQFRAGLASYAVIFGLGVALLLVASLLTFVTGVVTLPETLALLPGFFCLVLGAFLIYGALHAPELVYFHGLRAARSLLSDEENRQSDWRRLAQERIPTG